MRLRDLTALVINRDADIERMRHMSDLLNSLGMNYKRIAAVEPNDGNRLELQTAAGLVSLDTHLGNSELGCFLSHVRCWQTASKSKSSHSIIFEDDVLASGDIFKILDLQDVWGSADIFRLEAWPSRCEQSRRTRHITEGFVGRRCFDRVEGAAAYVISSNAAMQLLRRTTSAMGPVDKYLFHRKYSRNHRLLIETLSPSPFVQHKQAKVMGLLGADEWRDIGDRRFFRSTIGDERKTIPKKPRIFSREKMRREAKSALRSAKRVLLGRISDPVPICKTGPLQY